MSNSGNERARQALVATSAAGLQPRHLFYVTDRSSGLRFVNTGAEVSVIPPSRTDCTQRQDCPSLRIVNNTAIATYGTRSLTLVLGLQCTFQWIFIITDVKHPILGADFPA